MEPTTTTLFDVPPEMILHVFSFFTARGDLHSAMLANKTLCGLADSNPAWSSLYKRRFPVFYEMLHSEGIEDWKQCLRDTLTGKKLVDVQVYHRNRSSGFDMSCFTGRCSLLSTTNKKGEVDPSNDTYKAFFPGVNARKETEETCSGDQIRALPKRVRGMPVRDVYQPEHPENCKVGDCVELQWKKPRHGAFGWWFGIVDSIDKETGDVLLAFTHFQKTSSWYHINIPGGLGVRKEISDAGPGGYIGHFRPMTEETEAYGFFKK